MDAARFVAKYSRITKKTVKSFESDRKAMYLIELQSNVLWIVSEAYNKFVDSGFDDIEALQILLNAELLYCRTTIAMYENLIKAAESFSTNPKYWTKLFSERIDKMEISLYKLTTIVNDDFLEGIPTDMELLLCDDGENSSQISETIVDVNSSFDISTILDKTPIEAVHSLGFDTLESVSSPYDSNVLIKTWRPYEGGETYLVYYEPVESTIGAIDFATNESGYSLYGLEVGKPIGQATATLSENGFTNQNQSNSGTYMFVNDEWNFISVTCDSGNIVRKWSYGYAQH